MKDKIFGVLQRVGRSFMLPIAILPVAGLLLGVGGSFTNETMLRTYGLWRWMGPGSIFYAIFEVMKNAGDIVFANLPILFAMGVAIGMARKEKEVAALAASIAFFVMHASLSAMITLHGGVDDLLDGAAASVVGITSLQMGVFGGILVGLGVAFLHNRFYKIQLPQVLSFFGGTRFVPIISALVYTGVGILMFYLWPPVQSWIYTVGDLVLKSGYVGTWIYGLMERLLIPFGLHHVFYLPFWQTAVGGTLEVDGVLIEGAQNIFFAQLADPNVEKFAVSATRFMSGKFPLMIFGLPGAALAMYKAAREEKKKIVGGLLLSAALTSMLTGITEPIEFTFLFAAPVLYVIHCILAGLAYLLMHVFEVGVGMTFSGGLIDLILFGVLQGNQKTNWVWIVIVGIGYFILYYLLFSVLIQKFDLQTPGRDEQEEVKLYTRADLQERSGEGEQGKKKEDLRSKCICEGLGGKNNIGDLDCCATRLRCTVVDGNLIDVKKLKETGASGVIHKGNGVQIIYGPKVTVIKSDLEDYLEDYSEDYSEEKGSRQDFVQVIHQEGKEERKTEENRVIKKDIKSIEISSPITGVILPLKDVPDEAFSQKVLGDGAGIEPTKAEVVAPEKGEISFVFDTKHAIGFLTDTGVNLLIHVGIDTVELKGEGFTIFAEAGQKVEKGTKLMELDLDYLKKNAKSIVSPVICTELEENQMVRLLKEGTVKAGEPLLVVETIA